MLHHSSGVESCNNSLEGEVSLACSSVFSLMGKQGFEPLNLTSQHLATVRKRTGIVGFRGPICVNKLSSLVNYLEVCGIAREPAEFSFLLTRIKSTLQHHLYGEHMKIFIFQAA